VYGSDHSSYRDAIDDVSPSNWTIGGTVQMPVFDGFHTSAMVQTASLELKKQFIQRDKAIAELMTRLSTMRSNLMYLERQTEDAQELLYELMDKEKSTKRLVDKKEITPIEWNQIQVELLEQEIELIKNSSTVLAILKGIQVLTTY
jgi:outer membrane protein TolC